MDCYYHPKHPLLNFCTHPACSLPLCPKCISIHLSDTSAPHNLVPLNEAIESTAEQLQTACSGLAHELKSLREEYEPKNVLKDYSHILQKYRRQAIDEINRHYDYLERQLLSEISSRYAQHLQNLQVPIQNELELIQKAKSNIRKHDKSIESLILVVSEQRVAIVEDLLTTTKQRKNYFKTQLPRLVDGEPGKLKMTAQRLEATVQRLESTFPTRVQMRGGGLVGSGVGVQPVLGALAGLDRIAQLEARLHSLRYTE